MWWFDEYPLAQYTKTPNKEITSSKQQAQEKLLWTKHRKHNFYFNYVQKLKKNNYFTLKELTAIKSKLQDLTREVERLNNVRNPTPKSLSNKKKKNMDS